MLDDATTGASTPLPRCMWCSAELPSTSEVTCPTCGATLIGEGDNRVPGVTAIDAEAIIRAGRDAKPRQRSRLMSWLSGEYPEEDRPAPPGSLDPPTADVRREMLRLELEAQVANLQAEAEAMAAEQAGRRRRREDRTEVAAADAAAALAAADAGDRRRRPSRDRRRRPTPRHAATATDDRRPARARRRPPTGRRRRLTSPAGYPRARARPSPRPGPSFLREHDVRVGDRLLRAGMSRPTTTDDGWWLTILWVADDAGVVSMRDLASAAGPPPDPPLGPTRAGLAGSLSGLILEDAGRLSIRVATVVPADDPTRPWQVPAAIRAAFRWEPARAATLGRTSWPTWSSPASADPSRASAAGSAANRASGRQSAMLGTPCETCSTSSWTSSAVARRAEPPRDDRARAAGRRRRRRRR